MSNMVNSGDVYGRAGQWLIGTAKRNPEALLVLAELDPIRGTTGH